MEHLGSNQNHCTASLIKKPRPPVHAARRNLFSPASITSSQYSIWIKGVNSLALALSSVTVTLNSRQLKQHLGEDFEIQIFNGVRFQNMFCMLDFNLHVYEITYIMLNLIEKSFCAWLHHVVFNLRISTRELYMYYYMYWPKYTANKGLLGPLNHASNQAFNRTIF